MALGFDFDGRDLLAVPAPGQRKPTWRPEIPEPMPFQHIDGSTTLDGILAATRIAGHLPLHFSSRIIEIAWQIQDCRLNSNDFLYDFWANPVPFGSIKVGAWT